MKIIKSESYKKVPWKNGQGFTFEIAAHPEILFDWRISTATVDRDSEFSLYPEYDRTLIVLDGSLKLIQHPHEQLLQKFEPYYFSGDTALRCELVNGPIHDLNIFTRKHVAESRVDVVEIKPHEKYLWSTKAKENFAFIARGFCDHPPLALGDSFRVGENSEVQLHSPSGAVIILISIN